MKNNLIILLLLLVLSCNTKPAPSDNDNSLLRNPVYPESKEKTIFDTLRIETHALGAIRVGDNIRDIDSLFNTLRKKEVEAWSFGFDGGGAAYFYTMEEEPLFGLIPAYESDSIIGIVALHRELKTSNGIHPKMTAGSLASHYPDELFYEQLLTGRESLYDSVNAWHFVFETDSSDRIGVYPEIEVGSKPKRLTPQMDWVLIR